MSNVTIDAIKQVLRDSYRYINEVYKHAGFSKEESFQLILDGIKLYNPVQQYLLISYLVYKETAFNIAVKEVVEFYDNQCTDYLDTLSNYRAEAVALGYLPYMFTTYEPSEEFGLSDKFKLFINHGFSEQEALGGSETPYTSASPKVTTGLKARKHRIDELVSRGVTWEEAVRICEQDLVYTLNDNNWLVVLSLLTSIETTMYLEFACIEILGVTDKEKAETIKTKLRSELVSYCFTNN